MAGGRPPSPIPSRFWPKVDIRGVDDCWEWTGYRYTGGYGWFCIGARGKIGAHRMAYELANNVSPGKFSILHTCDNPPCCNPRHLRLGSHEENMKDAASKGRMKKSNRKYGAKLTEQQVREIRKLRTEGGSLVDLSRQFGVTTVMIGGIINRRFWKEVL